MQRFSLSKAAAEDIAAIGLNGLVNFGPAQARLYHDKLLNCLDLLARNPKMGVQRHDLDAHVRFFSLSVAYHSL